MPYSFVLQCVTTNGTLRAEDLQGQKGMALFLHDLVQYQDPTVAAQLHAPHKAKAFTTTLLAPARANGKHAPQRRAELPSELSVRITLLDDALYPLVSQFFLRHIGGLPPLRLGQAQLNVARVLATPDSGEPWAGFARFAELWAAASAVDETAWRLHFATPTVFKTGDADMPLPIPRLCFQSWLTSWEVHAPQSLFPDAEARKAFLTEVVERQVSVDYDYLRLAHHALFFDGARTGTQGFIGTCRFTLRPARVAPEHRTILAALARYSYYAGTGRKTTMGMGMTRFLGGESPNGRQRNAPVNSSRHYPSHDVSTARQT